MEISKNKIMIANPTPPDRSTFILAVLMILATLFLFSGCRTKKTVLDKKEEKVSVLEKKDVVTSEKEDISTSTIDLSESKIWSFTPVDVQKPSKMIYKGDTLSFSNIKIDVNENQANTRTSTNTSREKNTTDKSSQELEAESKSKHRTNDVKSSSWGLNLGIIFGIIAALVLLYFHIQKP